MYFILVTLLLLVIYITLLVREARRGRRFFAAYRERLDRFVGNGAFIARHVDFNSFAREEVIHLSRQGMHILAHRVLLGVRAAERLLTRLVRHLRLHTETAPPGGESSRSFVRTLSEFKGHLEATRPEMPEVR